MVDRDRQVEGVFTGYSPAMERSILKKTKFLDEPAPPIATQPTPPPAPPRAAAAEAPRAASTFANKLLQALVPRNPGKEN
jgi:hypothetical protein